jgi:hypothetical protein
LSSLNYGKEVNAARQVAVTAATGHNICRPANVSAKFVGWHKKIPLQEETGIISDKVLSTYLTYYHYYYCYYFLWGGT